MVMSLMCSFFGPPCRSVHVLIMTHRCNIDDVVTCREQMELEKLASLLRSCSHTDAVDTLPQVCTPLHSVAEWLACWTRAQKGPGSNRSRDTVG